VPHDVVSRAEQVLSGIEEDNILEVKAGKKIHKQALLLTPEKESTIEEELKKINLVKLTPMEAYVKLSELKKKLGGSRSG